MTGPLLEVRHLRVEFNTRRGTLVAIDDVSFTIAPGEVLGVVGESGAGKSITGTAIIGLLERPGRIAGGEVLLEGSRIDNLPPEQLRKIRGRRIGAIFQDPLTSLNPLYTVGRQIVETIQQHLAMSAAEARARAIQLLGEVGIPAPERRVDDYPHKMSGGMRQRVMIAMALACRPDILIADEPTTALDVTVQAQIFDLLRELQRERGTAIVLITHDMGAVAEMADRVMVMYAGRVIEQGTTEQVLGAPLHPYTQGLIACLPELGSSRDGTRHDLNEIRGVVPSIWELGSGCAFRERCPYAMPRCARDVPPMQGHDGHGAACWLVPETTALDTLQGAVA